MNQFAPCPKCQNAAAEPVKFTLWGGVLGPKLTSHVKCQSCGAKYNGKTGKSNALNITIYILVTALIVAVIFTVLSLLIR